MNELIFSSEMVLEIPKAQYHDFKNFMEGQGYRFDIKKMGWYEKGSNLGCYTFIELCTPDGIIHIAPLKAWESFITGGVPRGDFHTNDAKPKYDKYIGQLYERHGSESTSKKVFPKKIW